MAKLSQGFETQDKEIQIEALPVHGAIPAWLTGTLVRNTPAQYEVNGKPYRHWFDGLAMLHTFTFGDGKVRYANRYLQTPAYEENNAEGRIKYGEFATDPCRDIFSRVFSFFTPPQFGANTNVTVTRLADEYIARTEYPMSMKFDPETLDSLGIYDHEGMNGQITSAHPHHDYARDTSYNYQLELGRECTYRLYGLRGGVNPQQVAKMTVEQPAYMHSFGMSERYLILTEFPLKLAGGALGFVFGNEPFIENYEWMPEQGTRITVFDKDSGEIVTQDTVKAFFAFHHVNAFERDGELVMDISAYADKSIIDRFYMDNLKAENVNVPVNSQLRRYHIPLNDSDKTTYETVADVAFDLPRFDYKRSAGKPYHIVYGAGTRAGSVDFINQLAKINVETGETQTWYETGMYPGEPVYIPAPDAAGEDDGVVLSVVLNGDEGNSFLLVLDAKTFTEQARAEVPQHIPFGFHGEFFGEVT
jgi:beta,beta-carotene 9',10'-dioxygenase